MLLASFMEGSALLEAFPAEGWGEAPYPDTEKSAIFNPLKADKSIK